MATAHRLGITQGDLKPANVMLTGRQAFTGETVLAFREPLGRGRPLDGLAIKGSFRVAWDGKGEGVFTITFIPNTTILFSGYDFGFASSREGHSSTLPT
jgi:hypothetical protein